MLVLRKTSDALDDGGRALGLIVDAPEGVRRRLGLQGVRLQKRLRSGGVVGDRGKRLIEFVRERTRHFAHRYEALRFFGVLDLRLKLLLHLTPFGDVGGDQHHGFSVVRPDDRLDAYVEPPVRHFVVKPFANRGLLLRFEYAQDAAAGVGRAPEKPYVGGVHEKDLPSVVVRHDGDGARKRLHDAREAVVCGLHAFVRALRFGHVVECADVAEHPSFDVKELRDA